MTRIKFMVRTGGVNDQDKWCFQLPLRTRHVLALRKELFSWCTILTSFDRQYHRPSLLLFSEHDLGPGISHLGGNLDAGLSGHFGGCFL